MFLETQLADMVDRLEHDHVLDVIRKTARKMSPAGIAAVAQIDLAEREQQVLADALA